jgi:hypothetical protein
MTTSAIAPLDNQNASPREIEALHWRGNVKDMEDTYRALPAGSSEIGHELTVRGVVSEIVKDADNFKMYVIKDRREQTVLRVICREGDYVPIDEMTFAEMHDDVEVGDTVNVVGYPHRSQSGNLCLYSNFISVVKYGNNEYEREVPTDEDSSILSEDDTYVPDDESEVSDTEVELVDESDSGTETEYGLASPVDIESHSEHSVNELDVNARNFFISEIPLKIYNGHLVYNNVVLEILAVHMDQPFKVSIGTERGLMFTVTKLGLGFIGVTVPSNSIEQNCNVGYDVLVSGSFEEILSILQ